MTAEPVTDADQIKDLLIKQLYSLVHGKNPFAHMMELGVDTFIEIGTW